MDKISGNFYVSGSPVSINFADVDKLRLKKPRSELLPCNMPVSVKLTAAETAMSDLFVTLTGKCLVCRLRKYGGRGVGGGEKIS